ncbi:hypothetical protein J6590_003316 [Homalodisca vitripennis]|nr:hypothetical protein J6590_003316 [Homalodisca vitripennis]
MVLTRKTKPSSPLYTRPQCPATANIGGVYSADGQVVVHRRHHEWPIFRKNSRKSFRTVMGSQWDMAQVPRVLELTIQPVIGPGASYYKEID